MLQLSYIFFAILGFKLSTSMPSFGIPASKGSPLFKFWNPISTYELQDSVTVLEYRTSLASFHDLSTAHLTFSVADNLSPCSVNVMAFIRREIGVPLPVEVTQLGIIHTSGKSSLDVLPFILRVATLSGGPSEKVRLIFLLKSECHTGETKSGSLLAPHGLHLLKVSYLVPEATSSTTEAPSLTRSILGKSKKCHC